ncbi:MAG: UDP-N-acetylmuramoyl-L-alanyl-D-glutamate--2,6-diaminopimelate ligase [Lewinella sp.]
MQLTQLIDRIQPLAVSGELAGRGVSCVVFDSRNAVPGCLFVAVKGTQVDGHAYIDKAISLGATVIVGEDAGAMEVLRSKQTLSPGPSPRERGDGSVVGEAGERTDIYWSVPEAHAQVILGYAKKMRSAPTPAEKVLWSRVRASRLGHKVYRQRPMGYSIADFAFLEKRVIVEVDGGYHESPEMEWSDAERTQKLEAVGYKVLRFTNDEVLAAPFDIAAKIKAVLDKRENRPFPYPTEVYYGTPSSITPPTPATSPLSRGEGPGERVTYIQVADSAKALAQLAAAYHLNPSKDLTLIGITGTNGKTTVATLLHDLFTKLGYKAGLLSTVEIRIGSTVVAATHTTPDALAINANLAEMRDAGCDYVFMEVSSHAVAQQRTEGLHFNGGVFTNLSHDHLDYHETFAAYRDAKKGFFDQLPKGAFALVNADDKNGDFMLQNTKASSRRYSLRKMVDYRARVLSNSAQGLQLELDGTELFTRFIGRFNAYNLLAAFGVATELEMDRDEVLVSLSSLTPAAGRLDYVSDPTGGITAVVDYAHTPDALENVLETLRGLLAPTARLLCVVGAGGDRDKTKRPEMARLAASMADQAILTSDNPRSEDPEVILNDMQAGLDTPQLVAKTLRITDRRSAIRTAVQLARNQDIVLVAGKGHETYQEIKGERFAFDDKLELANALNARSHVS